MLVLIIFVILNTLKRILKNLVRKNMSTFPATGSIYFAITGRITFFTRMIQGRRVQLQYAGATCFS